MIKIINKILRKILIHNKRYKEGYNSEVGRA